MALSPILVKAGFEPNDVDAAAHVTVSARDEGFKITRSHLVCVRGALLNTIHPLIAPTRNMGCAPAAFRRRARQ